MRKFRHILIVLWTALFLAALLSPPALAAEAQTSLIDAAELDSILAGFAARYGLTEESFSFGYCYTGTNEEYYWNGDSYMFGASIYKLPLCMLVAEKVAGGEYTQEALFAGYSIHDLEQLCLVQSDNDAAGAAYAALNAQEDIRWQLARYSGLDREELPEAYWSHQNYFSPRFMIGTLRTLYEEPERFPHISEHLLQAQPEYYFRALLEGQYDIEQKYGSYEGFLNTVGIIHTPVPLLLAVMTHYVSDSPQLIGELAEAMADYTLLLDERLAAAQATPTATSATPAPTPRPAPPVTPAAAAPDKAAPEMAKAPKRTFSALWLVGGGAALAVGLAAALRRRTR